MSRLADHDKLLSPFAFPVFLVYALVYIRQLGYELDFSQCQSSGARAGTFWLFMGLILVWWLWLSFKRVSAYRRLLSFRLVFRIIVFYAAVAAWSTIYSFDVHKLIIICARRCEAAARPKGRKCQLPASTFAGPKGAGLVVGGVCGLRGIDCNYIRTRNTHGIQMTQRTGRELVMKRKWNWKWKWIWKWKWEGREMGIKVPLKWY